MVRRVQRWLAAGKTVKIMTARAYPANDTAESLDAIKKWCRKYIGQELEITYKKDFSMIELWDDRAVTVELNTGRRLDGKQDI